MKKDKKYKIDLRDIPECGLSFEEKISTDYMKGIATGELKEPVFFSGEVYLSGKSGNARGKVSFLMEFECCRCLEKYELPMESDFNVTLRQSDIAEDKKELSLEEEVYVINEDFLDLADLACEQIVLTLPMQSLCSEICKGLCSRCGKNLNKEKCDCPDANIDARFAVLAKLKENV